jgi:hypothetical protein
VATDDLQRLVTGIAPAPAIFTVPGNGQIRPKSIFASFDGTGAGSAFFPTLKVISDAGKTVGIYSSDTSVAAGASADVSWFPKLASAASAPPSSSGLKWAAYSAAGFTNVPAWAGGTPGVASLDGDHVGIYTNDASIFQITTKVIGGFTFHGVGVKVPGHYLAKAQVIIDNGDTAGTVETIWSDTPGFEDSYGSAGYIYLPIGSIVRGVNQVNPYMEALVTCGAISYPTDPFLIQVTNHSGAIVRAFYDMIVFQLDTDQTPI